MGCMRARTALAACLLACGLAPASANAYFDVAKLPPPPVTGKEIADNVASFSETYAHRVTDSPAEQAAAAALRDEATSLGYDTKIIDLPLAGSGPDNVTHAVVAVRRGRTKPDEHLVFTAHYDVVPQTINGAYDNATGTNMLRALARSLAQVPTNRTLVFAWYNGEEEGTLASEPHAQSFKDAGKIVRAQMGFDMVGIAWPVAKVGATNCLCMWRGEDDERFDALLSHVNFDVLGFPRGDNLVEVRGINTRNSDEASWDTKGYPTMRWAGLRTAANYPAYHRYDDTMETIDSVAGGRTFFEQGLRNTLLSSYYTALTVDNDPPVAVAHATGTGPVRFDAAGSGDPDGAPAGATWDFGDGTSAKGETPAHTYARSGDYTAKVTVADNLWPQVTSTATVPVHAVVAAPAAKKKAARRARCRKVTRRRHGKRVVVRVCPKAKHKKKTRRKHR